MRLCNAFWGRLGVIPCEDFWVMKQLEPFGGHHWGILSYTVKPPNSDYIRVGGGGEGGGVVLVSLWRSENRKMD